MQKPTLDVYTFHRLDGFFFFHSVPQLLEAKTWERITMPPFLFLTFHNRSSTTKAASVHPFIKVYQEHGPVFSTRSHLLTPALSPTSGDIWQYLETFLVITTRKCYWDRASNTAKHAWMHKKQTIQLQMSRGLRWRTCSTPRYESGSHDSFSLSLPLSISLIEMAESILGKANSDLTSPLQRPPQIQHSPAYAWPCLSILSGSPPSQDSPCPATAADLIIS